MILNNAVCNILGLFDSAKKEDLRYSKSIDPSVIHLFQFSKLEMSPPHYLVFFINRIERKRREKEEQETYKLEQKIALWDPQSNPEGTTDPFRTLFVSRINFYTSESKLKREFETYGPIKQIKIVSDQKTGKPRGYCFIEFEQEKDMHCKYFVHFAKTSPSSPRFLKGPQVS